MRIGILSFRPEALPVAEETLRLVASAEARGHQVEVFDRTQCQLVYDDRGERVFYKGQPFPELDIVLPRVSLLSNVELRLSIVKQFEMMGVPVLNGFQAVSNAKNKLRTLQILHSLGIPTPKTVVIHRRDDLKEAIEIVGGTPVILKDPFGSFGEGVMIAESLRAARSVMDTLKKMILVQEYIAESQGRDTRVFVVGGKVIASMERSAQAEEFRSNVELGAEVRKVDISLECEKMALESAQALGLDYAGVDIIQTKKGPAILEVNGNPGFKALEEVSGVDVAGSLIALAELKVKVLENQRSTRGTRLMLSESLTMSS